MKVFFLLFSLVLSSFSLEIEAGKEYKGFVSLEFSPEGLSFTLADGWVARLDEAFTLTASRSNGQIISIITTYPLSEDSVMDEMNQVQDMGDGIFLHPISEVQKISPTLYMADYKLSGVSVPMKSRIYVVLSTNTKALVFIGASQDINLKLMQEDISKMAKSARSFTIVDIKKNNKAWKDRLKG